MFHATLLILALLAGFLLWLHESSPKDVSSKSCSRPITLKTETENIQLHTDLTYFLDTTSSFPGQLNHIPEEKLQAACSKIINLGHRKDRLWLHFSLFNDADHPLSPVLELGWPFLKNVHVYSRTLNPSTPEQETEVYHSLIETGGYRHRVYVLSMDQHRVTEVLIGLQSSAQLLVPLVLWSSDNFSAHRLHEGFWFAAFFSAIIVMLLYNLLLCYVTRDISYLYYCIYVCSILFYVLSFSGYGAQYAWRHFPWLQHHVYGISSSFSFLAVVLFMRTILSLRSYGGWVLQLNNFFVAAWSIIFLAYFSGSHPLVLTAEDTMAFFSCPAGLATTIYLWKRGNISAKYLTIAWTILILATFLLMLGLTNVIAYSPLAQYLQNGRLCH